MKKRLFKVDYRFVDRPRAGGYRFVSARTHAGARASFLFEWRKSGGVVDVEVVKVTRVSSA